jgi:glycosyltransferase involved in cell wall biosynthesis
VVIPTLGASPFFAEAIASALAEAPAEVVVVRDGGAGSEVGAAAAVRVLALDRVGRSAARNAGAEAARTPFVAFLDDDDVIVEGSLRRRRDALARVPAAPLAFGRVGVVDADGRPVRGWNELLDRRFEGLDASGGIDAATILAARAPIYTSATLVRRDAFLSVRGYDPALDAYEDLDLYLRLARLGRLLPIEGDRVAKYRLHGSNTRSERLYEGLLTIAAKHLPEARGALRRHLLERQVDALWALRRAPELRRAALRAARDEPVLLAHPRFAGRLAASLLPGRLLEARR